jgi:hypothetical protein
VALSDLLLVSSDKICHAIEAKVDRRHLARVYGGAKALLVVPTVNPAVRQTMPVRRLMVVKHAFRHMQDFILGDCVMGQRFEHVFKIAVVGLITANILGSHYRVEGNAKAGVGA